LPLIFEKYFMVILLLRRSIVELFLNVNLMGFTPLAGIAGSCSYGRFWSIKLLLVFTATFAKREDLRSPKLLYSYETLQGKMSF
jgi:hypothetical protein